MTVFDSFGPFPILLTVVSSYKVGNFAISSYCWLILEWLRVVYSLWTCQFIWICDIFNMVSSSSSVVISFVVIVMSLIWLYLHLDMKHGWLSWSSNKQDISKVTRAQFIPVHTVNQLQVKVPVIYQLKRVRNNVFLALFLFIMLFKSLRSLSLKCKSIDLLIISCGKTCFHWCEMKH